MKKIFEIFFEEIPVAQLQKERVLKLKSLLPKYTEPVELVLLKVILLFTPVFLLIYIFSIVFAIVFKIS